MLIRIVAAVVDTNHLTLYRDTGETIIIDQGDPRIRRIIQEATPMLLSKGYADVSLAETEEDSYRDFEVQTKGIIKLYRVAKDTLKTLFGKKAEEAVSPRSIGKVPMLQETIKHTKAAVEEILQHAVSVSSPNFHEENVAKQGNVKEQNGNTIKDHSKDTAPETIVAVVDGKIIPGMEKIKSQFGNAARLGSTQGIENFLRRLSGVIEHRKHSVEDLLKFLERGDLPIADDGSILIYKVLKRKDARTDGKFVDCHTGKVEQWTGAYVYMDPSLVDPNRYNECSNGLHVARRGYVKSFRGDVCVLAKLAPEDVIAVPAYDANKMRVCGYHIIMELSPAQYNLLNQNRPITDDEEGKRLLANAMSGNHVRKTHEVRITGQLGTNVVVTALTVAEAPMPKPTINAPVEVVALSDTNKIVDLPVNPKDVVQQVGQLTRKEQATKLHQAGDFVALKAMKKAAKVSWEKLGVPDPDTVAPVEQVQAIQPSVKTTAAVAVVEATHGEGSYRERIQKLLSIGLTSVGTAQAVMDLKKKSKKGWDTLGVTEAQVTQLTALINK